MTGIEKFVTYVNGNIGKPLTTGVIAERGRIHRRRVQMFCKAVRASKKVKTGKLAGRSLVYTFKKNITVKDLA
jgi:hypothetical protein